MGKNLKIDIGYPLLQPGDAGAFTPGGGGGGRFGGWGWIFRFLVYGKESSLNSVGLLRVI